MKKQKINDSGTLSLIEADCTLIRSVMCNNLSTGMEVVHVGTEPWNFIGFQIGSAYQGGN